MDTRKLFVKRGAATGWLVGLSDTEKSPPIYFPSWTDAKLNVTFPFIIQFPLSLSLSLSRFSEKSRGDHHGRHAHCLSTIQTRKLITNKVRRVYGPNVGESHRHPHRTLILHFSKKQCSHQESALPPSRDEIILVREKVKAHPAPETKRENFFETRFNLHNLIPLAPRGRRVIS